MLRVFFAIVLSLVLFTSQAQIPDKPKLIVHVVVEQMRYDYIFSFYSFFGRNGFAKLLREGSFCSQVHIPFAFPQTAPSYASIASGAPPSAHGIIGNSWHNRLYKVREHAITNHSYSCVGCSQAALYQVAPTQFFVSTFTDELKKATQGRARSFSVGLTPLSAILLSGQQSDGVYWLDDMTGAWVTSSFYTNALPSWLQAFNRKKFGDIYLTKEWTTRYPISQYTQTLADDTPFEIGISNKKTFPYNLSKLQNKFSPYTILKQTPFGNTFTKDIALELIEYERLGKGNYTDYITIAFTALGEIGNRFGSMSKEVQDCMIRLDFEIQFLLQYLEREIGKDNFLLIVSSNHGVQTPAPYLEQQNISTGIFRHVESMYILNKYLEVKYGEGTWVEYYFAQQIYLNRDLVSRKNLNLAEVQAEAADFLIQLAGVHTAVTAHAMNTGNFFDEGKRKMALSYNQKRSGDIFIELLPGWSEQITDVVAQHISSYSEVTHVPLFWYGWKVNPRSRISQSYYTTDIIPTLCDILGIPRPNMAYGTPIDGIFSSSQ